ncbi:MAG: RrF2 family transcriptional regulator [Planctomycetota bacterium]|jgi:Rrf2 family protein
MKVSKRGEYGMRALCHLAERHGSGLVHIRAIADEEEIPGKFLESILLQLKRAGFVVSRRGNEGGYGLSRPPDEILLGDVIRVLDGPLAPLTSAVELRRLMQRNPRQIGFYSVLMEVRDAVSEILDRTTLADVLDRNSVPHETSTEPA